MSKSNKPNLTNPAFPNPYANIVSAATVHKNAKVPVRYKKMQGDPSFSEHNQLKAGGKLTNPIAPIDGHAPSVTAKDPRAKSPNAWVRYNTDGVK